MEKTMLLDQKIDSLALTHLEHSKTLKEKSDPPTLFAQGFFPYQRTLKMPWKLEGIGIHSGQPVKAKVLPRMEKGIVFITNEQIIPACIASVSDTFFATSIGVDHDINQAQEKLVDPWGGKKAVSTIEHLMAAFFAYGISNATIELGGWEMPIYDGSAMPFVELIETLGIQDLECRNPVFQLTKTLEVEDNGRFLRATPSDFLSFSMTVDIHENLEQQGSFDFFKDSFKENVAPSRTFSRLKDIKFMQSKGLIKGGSLDNALVFDGSCVVNPQGLRFPNEGAYHKILDCMGDMALLEQNFLAHIEGKNSGHALNVALAKKMIEENALVQI
jgi:UDP-3-O-[3-hydroxymyristoyl] N-acetylglucosamine deacetylase